MLERGPDVFLKNRTDGSEKTSWLTDEQARKRDNVEVKIIYMTPKEYLQRCAEIFGSTYQNQLLLQECDKNVIDELKQIIVNGTKINLTYLNYAKERGQEGRHRMLALAQLYGWNKLYPVIVFTDADKELADKERRRKEQERYERIIQKCVRDTQRFVYGDDEEVQEQIEYEVERYFDGDPYTLQIEIIPDGYKITLNTATLEYDKDDFNWATEEQSSEEDDLDLSNLTDDELLAILGADDLLS